MENLKFLKQKGTSLQLGDKVFTLAYDLNSFAYLEEQYGGIDKAFEKIQAGDLKIKDVLIFIKAGIASSDEEIDLKEIGAYLNVKNISAVMEAVNKAILESLPADSQTKKSKN